MHRLKFDDSLDVFAVHGVGGILGMILTGIFAQYSVTNVDVTPGTATAGWLDHVWIQVPVQLAAIGAAGAWSLAVTLIIGYAMNLVPFLRLRSSEDDEMVGLDYAEVGEHAYAFLDNSIAPRWVDEKEVVMAVEHAPAKDAISKAV